MYHYTLKPALKSIKLLLILVLVLMYSDITQLWT